MKPITKERIEELLQYDRENGKFVWKVRRHKFAAGIPAGTLRADGYVSIMIDRQRYQAHRLVWFTETGEWPPLLDHINRVKNDNRFANLRLATSSQNQANTGLRKNNRLGARGVFVDARHPHRPYGAYITKNRRRRFIGYFATLDEAANAYNVAASEQWGEFVSN